MYYRTRGSKITLAAEILGTKKNNGKGVEVAASLNIFRELQEGLLEHIVCLMAGESVYSIRLSVQHPLARLLGMYV
jgi:hypothetical protein